MAKCGYKGDLIQEDYAYSDSSGYERIVPIAGFAYPSHDARDACIAAIDGNLLEEPTFESRANECRDIGAPLLFFCCREELQWWTLKSSGVVREDTIPAAKVSSFFTEHQEDFSPESIYRAKNLSRVHSEYQLKFVDRGLMPILEHEMGNRLADLIKNMLRILDEKLGIPQVNTQLNRWMFRCAFWLLGAKILQDKKVKNFIRLDLEDVLAVLERVNRHYGAKDGLVFRTKREQRALEAASSVVKQFSSLNNLTIESLAHVYETTLIDKKTRKTWGIHATPSYLVDYIVLHLSDWIRSIPQKNRIVLEPTCGHAPFLTSALRLLREIYEGDRADLHKYLNSHLLGIEQDLFAREIARLSLTLADVPNSNGWELKECDVYKGDILSKLASKSTILLCNPPFENFSPGDKQKCHNLETGNKAAEVLTRTLPYMPKGSVFGVILPQGFLHKDNLSPLRKMLIEQFELAEICALPENVFSFAKHKSMVLLGRKHDSAKRTFVLNNKIRFRRVPKWELDKFKKSYQASTDQISQSKFDILPIYDFRLPQLHEVWEYCLRFPRLKKVAIVRKGLEYKSMCPEEETFDSKKHLPPNALTISEHEFPDAVRGYAKFKEGIKLTENPPLAWMNLDVSVIRRPGFGMERGVHQVLLNYARVSHQPWRLKALIDSPGHPVTSSFLVIRPKLKGWQLKIFWALLNSPFANAFAYCNSLERLNLKGMVENIPLPACDISSLCHLSGLVQDYFDLYDSRGKILQSEVDAKEVKRRMLAIDAEVMRLYDLPPRLERQVLDLFEGWERKGVDFKFDRYYPEGFESWIPLHEYLSEEYQRSTVPFVSKWVEEVRSPQIIKAFEKAADAFKED